MTLTEAVVVELSAPRRLELRREPLAEPAPHELLCETIVTAISPGTEIAAYVGLPPLRPGGAYPRLQGYCNIARVLAPGAAVTTLAAGDRILSFSSHRSHFVMPASDALLRLQPEWKAEQIVCTYLFHLGYNAVLRSDVRSGSRVLVIGMGALGLATVAMARTAGATVVAVTDQARPAAIAKAYGAAATAGRHEIESARSALDDGLADVVVATTNSWHDWSLALQLAAPRGTIACLGFPGRGQPPATFNPLDSQYFYAKQLRIEAVGMAPERPDGRGFSRFNERDNLRFLAGAIASGRIDPSPLVSGTYRGEDIEQAYQALIAREGSPITFLLSWNP